MKYEKKKYEELISSSPLFSLDRSSAAFRRERYRMIENLYCYLMAVNSEDFESYGCEIMEIASRCIQNFDSEKGVFLHYFNSAWKQEYRHICGDEAIEKSLHGIRVTEEEKRTVKRFIKFFSQVAPEACTSDRYRFIADAMQITVLEVEKIAELASLQVTDEIQVNSDGEEISIYDMHSDGKLIEEALIQSDKVGEILSQLESCYNSLQERQKPIIADLITSKLCEIVFEEQIPLAQYSFFNAEIWAAYLSSGTVPSQRDIAQKYNRNEASISRTMKEFLARIENLL